MTFDAFTRTAAFTSHLALCLQPSIAYTCILGFSLFITRSSVFFLVLHNRNLCLPLPHNSSTNKNKNAFVLLAYFICQIFHWKLLFPFSLLLFLFLSRYGSDTSFCKVHILSFSRFKTNRYSTDFTSSAYQVVQSFNRVAEWLNFSSSQRENSHHFFPPSLFWLEDKKRRHQEITAKIE